LTGGVNNLLTPFPRTLSDVIARLLTGRRREEQRNRRTRDRSGDERQKDYATAETIVFRHLKMLA
jgi:hypothetical protein